MNRPKVTFLVPCYKLAHVLSECVESILSQTYRNFELLILDDCSPDNTPEVAGTFKDPRVRHIRNDPNLGHLRNYNKGIDLAEGEYIWLISADDRLRKPYVLERYLSVLEANPQVGYAFCPGVGLSDGKETGVVQWAVLDKGDSILDGRTFLGRLIDSNCVLAPSGLVRKRCYEQQGAFPLDLPFAGDWYLWSVFAAHHDVAYFSEPMVSYREHPQSMTTTLIAEDIWKLSKDDLTVRWRLRAQLLSEGAHRLADQCTDKIVEDYIHALSSKKWRGAKFRMTLDQFNESLATHASDPLEQEAMRARVFAGVGRYLYWDQDLANDPAVYQLALRYGKPNPKLLVKYGILCLGPAGVLTMRLLSGLRRATAHASGGRA